MYVFMDDHLEDKLVCSSISRNKAFFPILTLVNKDEREFRICGNKYLGPFKHKPLRTHKNVARTVNAGTSHKLTGSFPSKIKYRYAV